MAYPNWDEQTMRKRTHRRLLMLSGLAVILWIALIGWIFWWLPLPDQPAAANPAKLTDFLAALTIVAVLIERVLETGFRIVQGVWRPAVAYYSHGMRWLKATEMEEAEAREWLQNVSTFYNNLRSAYNRRLRDLLAGTLKIDPLAPVPEQTFAHMDDLKKEAEFRLDAAKAMVDDAQQHLDEAENKLDSMMCHPRYRGAKAVVAIIVGPLIGRDAGRDRPLVDAGRRRADRRAAAHGYFCDRPGVGHQFAARPRGDHQCRRIDQSDWGRWQRRRRPIDLKRVSGRNVSQAIQRSSLK